MYKTKPHLECTMPGAAKLRITALNGSLKHAPDISNTEELAAMAKNLARDLVYYAQLLKQHPLEYKR